LPASSDKWHTSNTLELQYEMCHSVRNHHTSAIIIVKTLVIFLSFIEAVGLLLNLSSSSDSSTFLNYFYQLYTADFKELHQHNPQGGLQKYPWLIFLISKRT
jgi:hypothetical protein